MGQINSRNGFLIRPRRSTREALRPTRRHDRALGGTRSRPANRLSSDHHASGGRNDLDRRPAVADEPGKLQPVHRTRHLDIGEDDADIGTALKDRDGFIGIGRLNDFKSGVLDRLGGIQPQQEFVFDNQDHWRKRAISILLRSAKRLGKVLFRLVEACISSRRVHHGAACTSGIVKTNRVSSGVEVTSILPPCACAICEAICSPSPRPWRLSRTSPRKNGSNSLSMAAAGMGSPAFATQSLNNSPPSVFAPTRTGWSAAPWVRALPIKFDSNCPIRVRSQLTGSVDLEAGLDHAPGRSRSQFVDDLLEDRLQRPVGVTVQRDAAAQPSAREIQDVVDQVRHTGDGGIDHVEDAELLVLLQRARPLQDPRAGADRRERIAEVVTEHGDELLAQFRSLPLGRKTFLKLRPGIHQLALIAPPVGRLDDHQRRKQQGAVDDRGVRRALAITGSRSPAAVSKSSANSLKKPCIRSRGAMWVS